MSFADAPNPYQPPSASGGPLGQSAGELARGKTLPVGICLLVIGILGLIIMGTWSLLSVVGVTFSDSPDLQPPPGATPEERTGYYIGFYGTLIALFASALFQIPVILAGISLIRLRGRAVATAGCIVTFLPCIGPCCLLAFPFGIWGLIVLSDPNVKFAMSRS